MVLQGVQGRGGAPANSNTFSAHVFGCFELSFVLTAASFGDRHYLESLYLQWYCGKARFHYTFLLSLGRLRASSPK